MNRAALLAALKTAAPALGDDGSALPALSHFCFEDDTLYAFNDVVAVIVGLKTGWNLGLHGATLLGVLGASKAEDVELKVKGSVATLTGSGKVELPVLPAADFVFTLPDTEPIFTSPLFNEIRAAIEVCLISVAEASLRPEYNGVTINLGKSGTILFSTDNITATRVEPGSAKVPARKDAAVVLPKDAAELLLKLFPKEGQPQIRICEKIAIVEFGGNPEVTLITKLLGTPSSKFNDIFTQHAPKGAQWALPEGLDAEVEKAIVLTSRDSLKECTLFAGQGELVVSASGTLGKMRSVLKLADAKAVGGVTVNPDFLKRVLPYVSKFTINDEASLVLGAEGLSHVIACVPKAGPAGEEAGSSDGK